MIAYIYMTTNLITGHRYIGQHKGEINDKYLGSGIILNKAIERYGRENFKKEILEICDIENLDEKEKYWIKYYNAFEDDNFYNLTEGGQKGDGWKAAYKWFQSHPIEAQKIYKENGERLKEWNRLHPEETQKNIMALIEGSKRWRKENPEKMNEIMKKVNKAKEEWQQEHYEEWQSQVNEWRIAGSIANSKKVKCITTGEIFNSVSEAARHYGLAQPNISKVLKGERKSCGKLKDGTKLTWEWA